VRIVKVSSVLRRSNVWPLIVAIWQQKLPEGPATTFVSPIEVELLLAARVNIGPCKELDVQRILLKRLGFMSQRRGYGASLANALHWSFAKTGELS
jgi:hypothetical protein